MSETIFPEDQEKETETGIYMSNFDKLAEMTEGRKVDIDPKLRSEITGEFLGRFAQGGKTQSEIVKELIEEHSDVEVLRPYVQLSRE